MNMKKINEQITALQTIIRITSSLFSLSLMRVNFFKRKINSLQEQYEILRKIIGYEGGVSDKKCTVGFYSDIGLCGTFNQRVERTDFYIGSQQHRQPNFLSSNRLQNYSKVYKSLQSYNTMVAYISNKESISSEVSAIDQDILFEGDDSFIAEQYRKYFLLLVWNRSLYLENLERLKATNTAMTNSKEREKQLKIQRNKTRQENITNDLNCITSGVMI